MFIHNYLVRSLGGYWNGGSPESDSSWVPFSSGYAVRFFTKRDAEAVVQGVLRAVVCTVEADG